MTGPLRPTRAEVDLEAIGHNVTVLREVVAPSGLLAVVKADAYGHGAVPVARAAVAAGAAWLGVALVEEGEELRSGGIAAPILVMTEPPAVAGAVDRLVDADLTPTVYTRAFAGAVGAAARRRARRLAVHVKADTGMGRVGAPRDEWEPLLAALAADPDVEVEALWSHLACAELVDHPSVGAQLAAFEGFRAAAAAAGLTPRLAHLANSAAALALPAARCDLVRCGIAAYGVAPGPGLPSVDRLRPAMRFVTEVALGRRIRAGEAVGYGHTWTAPDDGFVAALPVGYADGVPRLLSNQAAALIRGVPRPFAGTVSMDQTTVWCGSDDVQAGEEVVLIGSQGGAKVTAEDWAALAGTIGYEVVTRIGPRVPRVYRPGG